MNYCICDTRDEHTASECLIPGTTDTDVMQADIRAILEALGLGTHARPYSTHAVVHRVILPAIEDLQNG